MQWSYCSLALSRRYHFEIWQAGQQWCCPGAIFTKGLKSQVLSLDWCPSLGVSHDAGELDGDLHRDSPLNITTKLVFVLRIQEITVTETKSMCWQILSNKYIYNRFFVLEFIVLWTRCVILVVNIANSRPGALRNRDVAIVDSRWRHNCCHWLRVKELHTDQATTRYMRITSWLRLRLNWVLMIFLC